MLENMATEPAPLTSAELSQLREILERDAIRRALERYARAMDRCDEVNARAAYWDDAHDNHGLFKGNAQDFITWKMASPFEISGDQHVLGQSLITVDGDRASAETYFVYYFEEGRLPLPNVVNVLAGRYVDSFERRGGEWKISDRVVVIDWSTVWRSDERFPGVDTFVPGERYPDDLVYKRPHSLA
jgi:hypothetical protein